MTADVPTLVSEYLRCIGRLGGRAKSPAKTAANRANAARPRPGARGKRKRRD